MKQINLTLLLSKRAAIYSVLRLWEMSLTSLSKSELRCILSEAIWIIQVRTVVSAKSVQGVILPSYVTLDRPLNSERPLA